MPGLGIDQRFVRHPGDVLPAGGIQGEELPYGALSLGGLLSLVGRDNLPEALHKAGVVSVAVLTDDRRDRGGVIERQPPPDRSTVVLHVYRVPIDLQRAQQALRQRGQSIEFVVELLYRWRVGKAESQMIRCDHVVAISERGH